jgi:hypothetical protein
MGLNISAPAVCLAALLAAGIVIKNWGIFEGVFEVMSALPNSLFLSQEGFKPNIPVMLRLATVGLSAVSIVHDVFGGCVWLLVV